MDYNLRPWNTRQGFYHRAKAAGLNFGPFNHFVVLILNKTFFLSIEDLFDHTIFPNPSNLIIWHLETHLVNIRIGFSFKIYCQIFSPILGGFM
jgi:hypothetical protein